MTSKTHIVSAPTYAAQFACIGGACPQTCCAGWSVDIDKSNYKEIKKIKASPGLMKKISQHIRPVEGSTSTTQYARVQMLADESCPMLNEAKLCDIQSELGEELLSKTCRFYPRSINALPQRREMYLTLSCPEAARLCLTQTAEWAHQDLDTHVPKGKPIPVRVLGGDMQQVQTQVLLNSFDLLRDFMLYCIQYQGAPLWHRIMVVGLTLKKITSATTEQWMQKDFIEGVILPIKLDLITGAFSAELEQNIDMTGKSTMQARFIQAMTDLRVMMIAPHKKQLFSPQFSELVMRSFDAYNQLAQENKETVQAHLSEALAGFEAQAPRFFENYLCNAVGKDSSLFCDPAQLEKVWLKISLRLALLRFYLKGLSASPQGLSLDEAIRMVYTFSKVIEHNSLYEKTVSDLLKEEQMDGMASVAIMLA